MTAIYGVWGHPIAHSLSPEIHNPEFQAAGIDALYSAFDIKPEDLELAVAAARRRNVSGFNLTIPHKQLILPYLDLVSETARAIGAVNTVVNRDGKLCGYNTDATGFTGPLNAQTGFAVKNKSCVILGTGGAARAIVYQLAKDGAAQITLLNRTVDRAEALAHAFASRFPEVWFTADTLQEPIQHRELNAADLVVQCTSRGLNSPILEFDWTVVNPNAIVCDIVYYGTDQGGFLDAAEAHGHKTFPGIWMLLGQAAEAFTLWTGSTFDVQRVFDRLASR